jgi:enoyl-CoA hydratase/carnithine racemase
MRAQGPSQSDAVTYEREDAIAWMTINRPASGNALSAEVRGGLWAGFRRFQDDPSAQVLVLTGAGERAFCAGADLKEMAATGLSVPPPDFIPHLGRNIDLDRPVVAAVNGAAYGGGFLLAQMCDLCVAVDTARFAVSEARWGRGAPWAAPLPWLIPPRVALELLLTGRPIDAARALEVGLVNRVVPAGGLREAAGELATTIAANAPLSVRAARDMVYASVGLSRRAAFDEGDRLFRPAYLSEDAQEGPLAFREKREPRWKGR